MQQTTFWFFLQKHNIEIPIIQRDYAQGRLGKEKLREIFLTDLKNAIDGNLSKDENVLKLDFVYGSVENGCLNPLDGQQRLTTLWLLHWFIANKAGKLSENKSVFRNFSYETRTSSREFCKKLSNFELDSGDSIVKLIQKQTWFFSVWKQDPTIQAMLNMLGGTPIKDNKNIDILDGIEEIFKDCDYTGYWEKLISENCPIVFYYLDLEGLSLSDDLYIKMNARGKSLTNFENFKADLVGFIKDIECDKGKQPKETIAHKLDTDWTNIFWKYRSTEHKIDDIYFAFINRYFLNSLITAKNNDSYYLYTQEEVESNKHFKFLIGESGNDSNIQYNGFDIYKSEEKNFNYKTLFEELTKSFDNFHSAFKSYSKDEINKLFLPSWDDKSNFRFIPEYESKDGNEIPTQLTQPQRVVFLAICRYFKNDNYDETTFRKWIRVVWNIVENANINTIPSMIGTMRLIDDLAKYSQNIYEHLKERDVSKDFGKEQMDEEKEKAKLVDDDAKWECKIIEAEKQPFFKGKIRILLKNAEFENKLKLCINKIRENNLDTLKVILTYIENKDLPLDFSINTFAGWRTNFMNKDFMIEVLKQNFSHKNYDNNWPDWKKVLIIDFDKINPQNCKIRNYYTNGWWGYDTSDVFIYINSDIRGAKLLSSNRKNILSKLIEMKIIKSNFPLYPSTNDRGQLWINQESFTDEFKAKLKNPDQVKLFLDKRDISLKQFTDSQWKDIPIENLEKLEKYLKESEINVSEENHSDILV